MFNKNIVKENKKQILFLLFLILVFILIKFKIYYSCDFYKIINDYIHNKDIFENEYLKGLIYDNGRPLQALIWILFYKLNLNYKTIIYIYKIIGDTLLFLSIFNIYIWLKDFIKNKYISILLSSLCLLNPFSIQFFLFDEAYMFFMISIFLSIVAFIKTIKFFDNKKIKDFLIINILLLGSILIYQISIGLYAVLIVLYIFLKEISFKDFIKNNLYLIVFYFIPTIILIILSSFVFKISKLGNGLNLMLNPFKILELIIYWLKLSSNLIFDNFYILIIFLIISYFFIFIKINFKKNIENMKMENLKLFYFIFASLIIPMAPYVSGVAYYIAIRVVFPLSIVFIGLLMKMFCLSTSKKETIILIVISILILCINLFFHFNVLNEGYRKNIIEKQYANEIVSIIEEYEIKENKKIQYISYYYDKNSSKKINKNLKYDPILIENAFIPDWSRISFITFFTSKKFIEKEGTKEILNDFKNLNNVKKLGEFNYIIENNTLHILIK